MMILVGMKYNRRPETSMCFDKSDIDSLVVDKRIVKLSSGSLLNLLELDIYNTVDGSISKDVRVNSINLEQILGVVFHDSKIYFKVIDKLTWDFLDYVDSPKFLGVYKDFAEHIGSVYNTTPVQLFKPSIRCKVILINDKVIIVHLACFLNIVDKNKILFLRDERLIITLFELYKLCFLPEITADTELYVVTFGDVVYKLDVNKGVMRFMTKAVVLRG